MALASTTASQGKGDVADETTLRSTPSSAALLGTETVAAGALLRPKVEGMVMMRSPLGTLRLSAQVARLRHALTRSLRVGRLLALLQEGVASA